MNPKDILFVCFHRGNFPMSQSKKTKTTMHLALEKTKTSRDLGKYQNGVHVSKTVSVFLQKY